MTQFKKENFTFDGEYLMYNGDFAGAKMMLEVHPDAHASWEGKLKPEFVARFKYNKRDRASFTKFLIANFTCEEYFFLMKSFNLAPMEVLRGKGYETARERTAQQSGGYNVLMQANY